MTALVENTSGKRSLPLATAAAIARSIVHELAPSCARIEIAGSIRRRRPEVGDIEILAQPIYRLESFTPTGELFSQTGWRSLLDQKLEALIAADALRRHPTDARWGEKYRKLWQPELGVQIDLFILAPPAEWGPALVIRTGPADFSREMVTQLRRLDMRCVDLRIETILGEHVPCPDEETFFRLCQYGYLAPERRY